MKHEWNLLIIRLLWIVTLSLWTKVKNPLSMRATWDPDWSSPKSRDIIKHLHNVERSVCQTPSGPECLLDQEHWCSQPDNRSNPVKITVYIITQYLLLWTVSKWTQLLRVSTKILKGTFCSFYTRCTLSQFSSAKNNLWWTPTGYGTSCFQEPWSHFPA